MATHTPGPWSIYFNSQDDRVIRKMFPDGQESHSIARCHSGAANALLIAAAPELLEALQAVLRSFPTDGDMRAAGWEQTEIDLACRDYEAARAAVAKAAQ